MALKVGAVFGEAVLKTKKWTSGSSLIQKGAKKLGGALATVAKVGFIALSAAIVKSTFEANKFQKEFANVTTLLDGSVEDFQQISNSLLKLDARLGTTAELTQGLYQAISAGAESAAEGLIIVEQAAKFSIAALTDNATAVDVLTTAMNAYGEDVVNAAQASDIFFNTIKKGKITGAQLASTIGQSIPLFASTGIALEELSSGMAAMTKQGVSASESTTQLNAIINAFLKPSDKLTASLEKMGFESGAAFLKTEGLAGALKLLQEETNGDATALAELLPNIRAMRGAMALTGTGGKEFNKILASMADVVGVTNEAFEKQEITFQTLGNEFNKTQVIVGNISKIFADKLAVSVQGVLEDFNQFMLSAEGIATTERIIAKLTKTWELLSGALKAAGKVAGDILSVFLKLPSTIQILSIALAILIPVVIALQAALGPIGLILAGIGVAAFAAAAAFKFLNDEGKRLEKLNIQASGLKDFLKLQDESIQKNKDKISLLERQKIKVSELLKEEQKGIAIAKANGDITTSLLEAESSLKAKLLSIDSKIGSENIVITEKIRKRGFATKKLAEIELKLAELAKKSADEAGKNAAEAIKAAAAAVAASIATGKASADAAVKSLSAWDKWRAFVEDNLDTFAKKFKFAFDAIAEAVGLTFQGISDISSQFFTNELAKLENANNAEKDALSEKHANQLAALQQQLDSALITEEQFNTKKQILDTKAAAEQDALRKEQLKKENDLKKKQFDANKKLAIANIWINLASAVMGFWASMAGLGPPGWIMAGIMTGAAAGIAGVQTGLVAAQDFVPAKKEGGRASGLTRINEDDGEIVTLPDGSIVIPNDISRDIAAASGGGDTNINVNNPVVREESDIQKIANAVDRILARRAQFA